MGYGYLFQNTVDGARTAAAAHGDFVGVGLLFEDLISVRVWRLVGLGKGDVPLSW